MRERRLVSYYNSGPMYYEGADDTEDNDESAPSLGLGYRFIKRPYDQLCDTILSEPGFIKASNEYPLNARRKRLVETALDEEVNKVVHDRMERVIRGLAGRALLTGKSFAYRLSRWDWMFRQGRLLHPAWAVDDVYDDSFREWAFTGSLTLRELDAFLDRTRYHNGYGWSNAAIKDLKRWILEKTSVERDTEGQKVTETQIAAPFSETMHNTRLDVYWYFRKNGRRNPLGEERIDLYCISRWGCSSQISSRTSGDTVFKALSVATDADNQQIIYHLPDAFESVRECIVPCLLDSRVDGEQTMADMEGLGRMVIARVLTQEHIAGSMVSGLAWAVQPNFVIESGADENRLRQIAQEGGLGPWDGAPSGMKMMDKNNALTGVNGAANLLQMLGMSADQDAATGDIADRGANVELKDVAKQLIAQTESAVGRRKAKFFRAADAMAEQILEVFTRPAALFRQTDMAFHDVTRVQLGLVHRHGLAPAEFSMERVKGKCRRLSGDADKSTAISLSQAMLTQFGGHLSPQGQQFLAKEAFRAAYGDSTADELLPDQPQVMIDQEMIAVMQEQECLISLTAPQRNPADNPAYHVAHHMAAISARLRTAQQAGAWTPTERQGLQLLLQHVGYDIPGIPQQNIPEMVAAIKQIARVAASIQVMGATSELQLKQQDAQMQMMKLQQAQAHEQNLVQERAAKNELNRQRFGLALHGEVEDSKTAATKRAKMVTEMARTDMQPQGSLDQ